MSRSCATYNRETWKSLDALFYEIHHVLTYRSVYLKVFSLTDNRSREHWKYNYHLDSPGQSNQCSTFCPGIHTLSTGHKSWKKYWENRRQELLIYRSQFFKSDSFHCASVTSRHQRSAFQTIMTLSSQCRMVKRSVTEARVCMRGLHSTTNIRKRTSLNFVFEDDKYDACKTVNIKI